jgi:hypothetical protein
MRFLMLLYGDEVAEAALSREDRMRIVEEHTAFSRELREMGAFVSGEPLEASAAARTVRRRDRTVTDGPFMEAREQLGGFYVVECPDMAAAIGLAGRMPESPGLTIEVRPIPGP